MIFTFGQIENAVNQITQREINQHTARDSNQRLHRARGDIINYARQIGNGDVSDDACPLNQIYNRRLIDGFGDFGELRQSYELKRLKF